MDIELVLKGVELGRYARERIEHKIGKATERYHREVPVRIVVEDNKGTYRARVTTALNGKDLVGQHESRSVLQALDEAIVKFDRQLLKLADRGTRRARTRRLRRNQLDAVGTPTNGQSAAAGIEEDSLDLTDMGM